MAARREFVESFETPMTVNKAHLFGRRSGYAGHGRLSFAEFMGDTVHPYPTSLYRAYRKGHALGKELRAANDARQEETA